MAVTIASLVTLATLALLIGARRLFVGESGVLIRMPTNRVAAKAPQPNLDLADQLDRQLAKSQISGGLTLALARANMKMRVSEFMGITVGLVLCIMLAGWLITGVAYAGLLMSILGAVAPRYWLKRRHQQRLAAFQDQMPDVLSLLVSSLRSGYGITQAMKMITQEMPSPSKEEYGRVSQELALGYSLREALDRLVTRVGSQDLELVVTAINVQHEVGGNLGEILETIAETIRERMRIKGEMETMTSSQMMTGYMLAFLPVVAGALIMFINPTYMRPLFTFPWIVIPMGAGLSIGLGLLVIKNMIKTDF